jgi:glycosyltransferase A (GT-A) superfamily protein (DUF2064 family)
MLNQYLKQCCLLIMPGKETESGEKAFSAIHRASADLLIEKIVFTDDAETGNFWRDKDYKVSETNGASAEEFLISAFREAFDDHFRKVIMLTAAPEGLEAKHLEEAFLSLRILDFTLGPTKEGDIYLLGMNRFAPEFLTAAQSSEPFRYKSFQRRAGELKAALYKSAVM